MSAAQFDRELARDGWQAIANTLRFKHESHPGVAVRGVFDERNRIRRRATLRALRKQLDQWSARS